MYSLVRILVAYAMSLVFALAYGYIAAKSKRAEMVLIPLLDILQSIPVLSFSRGDAGDGGVVSQPATGSGAGFDHSDFHGAGVEYRVQFLFVIEDGAAGFAGSGDHLPIWPVERFLEMDLPFSTIGLVWNSMMSVAGGWFFLMACEMFVLGDKDFRLPGLGSYLQTAAGNGRDEGAAVGPGAMVAVIVLMDQLIWRPVITWADKFKFEQVESIASAHHSLLNFIRKESFLIAVLPANVASRGGLDDAEVCERGEAGGGDNRRHEQTARSRRWIGWVSPGWERLQWCMACIAPLASWQVAPRGLIRIAAQCGDYVSARESGAVDWRDLDDSGGSGDRVQSAICESDAATGAELAASIPATALFPVCDDMIGMRLSE